MKVLWYVNIPLPGAAAALGFKQVPTGGWLTGQLELLKQTCEVVVCHVTPLVKEETRLETDGVAYLFIPAKTKDLEACFARLVAREKPDVVHVFGTEYHPNCALVQAVGGRCVVSIQGLMSEYAKHYMDGLPPRYKKVNPLRRAMRRLYHADSIALEQRDFEKRGIAETAALRLVGDVIGRTAWDRAQVARLAPKARYHHVNENLRAPFYTSPAWQPQNCRRYSLFASQGFFPIKGLHVALAALPQLIARYPETHLYVGGTPPYTLGSPLLDVFVDYFFEYQHYIKTLIKQHRLEKYVTYTGSLNAEAMRERYLASHVFLSPSTIENSPNSVAEAMMLGLPVVASRVGGVESLLTDGEEGLLYNFDDTAGMVAHIGALFEDDALATRLSAAARRHAAQTHNPEENTRRLLEVYAQLPRP